MPQVLTMGEMLVEIMRPRAGMALDVPGEFLGPFPSGAPAIFIDTTARLGVSAGIIGAVGSDDFGHCLLDRLAADGVDIRHVGRDGCGATAVAFVTYFDDGSRKFIFHIDGTPAVRSRFPGVDATGVPRFFHVMGCSLMANDEFRQEICRAAAAYHAHGARISFDPNIRPELLGERSLASLIGPVMERCAVLMPGVEELKLVSGEPRIDRAVEALFESPALEIIVLKRGKQGATVFTRDEVVEIASCNVREVDATGAGDCFDAGFLAGHLSGKSLSESGRIAAAAGALNAAAFGPMEGDISPSTIRSMLGG
jgi:sugar/nucleoside kinase (ribokinase family)